MSAQESTTAGAPVLEPQFGSLKQQDFARSFGMWVFLASELLFFGPLLLGYLYLRMHHPEATGMASRHTDMLLGTVNTAVLLTSSLLMALAGFALQLLCILQSPAVRLARQPSPDDADTALNPA